MTRPTLDFKGRPPKDTGGVLQAVQERMGEVQPAIVMKRQHKPKRILKLRKQELE